MRLLDQIFQIAEALLLFFIGSRRKFRFRGRMRLFKSENWQTGAAVMLHIKIKGILQTRLEQDLLFNQHYC